MKLLRKTSVLLLAIGFHVPSLAQTPPDSFSASHPLTFGTSAVSYIQVPASEFRVRDSDYTYAAEQFGWGPIWGTSAPVGTGVGFVAGLHLPSGAKLVSLELDSIDTNANSEVYANMVECDLFSRNCVRHPIAGSGPADCEDTRLHLFGKSIPGRNDRQRR